MDPNDQNIKVDVVIPRRVPPDSYARRRFSALRFLVLILGVGLVASVAYFIGRSGLSPSHVSVEARTRELQEQRRAMELESVAAKQRQQVAIAKAQVQAVLDEGQKVLRLADEFQMEAKAWKDDVVSLLQNDRGKLIAGDPTYLKAFRAIYGERRPEAQEGEAIRTRVQTLLEPLKLALASENSTFTPSEDALAGLETQRTALLDLIRAYHQPRLSIQGILDQAARSNPAAAVTLAEALRQLAAQEADEQTKLIVAKVEQVRKEADQKLADEKAAKEAADQEARRKVVEEQKKDTIARTVATSQQADADRLVESTKADLKATATREAAEHDRKLKEAQADKVLSALTPFTTSGLWQPNTPAAQNVQMKPVSLTQLRAYGALDDSPNGYQKLLTAATHFYHRSEHDKIRPRWSFSPLIDHLTPDQLEQVKTAQRNLRDYGEVLVELHKLSP